MWDKQLYKCMRDVYRMASKAKKEDEGEKKWRMEKKKVVKTNAPD